MSGHDARAAKLGAYARLFETLSPETLGTLDTLCAPDIHFTDPFNDVRGVEAYKRILAHMFEDTENPRFEVLDQALTARAGYIRWVFRFRALGRDWEIPGMSEVEIDAGGRIVRHLDHWDSGAEFYAKLPLIGPLVRVVRRRLALKT
ncbi:nuclear transport factor 2 family protein [Futiania mangrovi]|uniref:Nuclear transport factor 2 family protein n=1 Tax=Futiania mangrovi TaxID=2959716 RepID=A0A9J6PB83_9PROT|nr:nuclear transport factor 2 family protein [Futiania mangrovii]MCP1335721.1 nuclear transport factor 2 family protein [Futiania mangrovii]